MPFWRRKQEEPEPEDPVARELAQAVPLHTGKAYASNHVAHTTVTEVGTVAVPGGVVAIGDPSATRPHDQVMVPVPPGRHPVRSTGIVHVNEDGSESAYVIAVSLVVAGGEGEPAVRAILRDASGGNAREPHELHWVSIDTAACGFTDAGQFATAMERDGWEDFLFETLPRQDLPWVTQLPTGGDLIAVSTGVGDGGYPVFGDYDAGGALLAVHVNFGVVSRDDLSGVER